jgi:hypothetical protein
MVQRQWMIAGSEHGPNIPCMPAILLARRLATGERLDAGARPCLDLITLEEFLAAIEDLDIRMIAE